MTDRGREFIRGEFARLLQDWYWPTEGLAPAKVQVYDGDTCLVIGKVLEEFDLMQVNYKLLTNHSPLLKNDNFSKLVPGYDPGHTLGNDVSLMPQSVMNDISILVLKTQELNPDSQEADPTHQTSPGPANPLNHILKLLNYSAFCRPTTEDPPKIT
ncbi:hypothetical protein DSO57_1037269 [Entomophthora muscae]|uniref:Uncharacterized protein n=1 Tax=Entomophthora muscae TaxID=34485 RepID=A0ACC2SC36_9FUNG|nr:hypothetical protein DSO57_1037269 [Entomophthora muscae]